MAMTKVKVFVDNALVDNLMTVQWTQPHLNLNEIPSFSFTTDNYHGRNLYQHLIGHDVKIYRNGSLEFYGSIEPKTFDKSMDGSLLKVEGKHKGYIAMQRAMCEGYIMANPGVSGFFYNPWQYGHKNVSGVEVDGVQAADIMRNLFGTLYTYQNFFENRGHFMTIDSNGATGFQGVTVYDNIGNHIAKLMAYPSGTGFILNYSGTVGQAHSNSLHNGPILKYTGPGPSNGQVFRGMGTLKNSKIILIGDFFYTGSYPAMYVCRNADQPISGRNYMPVTLSLVSGAPGGTDAMWSGFVTYTGAETTQNQLGYVIYPNGTGASGFSKYSNAMHYLRIDSQTNSDIGLHEGTIEPYVDPTSITGGSFVVNLLGLTRLDAAERVRKMTVTSDIVIDQANWDSWIDNDLTGNFAQRRGNKVAHEYSFSKYNVRNLEHLYDASNLVNNIIAKGAGTPPTQLTVVDTANLVDINSINTYGSRQGVFQDSSITDPVTLLRRAKAYLKVYSNPIETVKLQIINDWTKPWNVGDSVKIRDSDIGIDGYWRIVLAKYNIKGDGIEQIDTELGIKSYKASDILAGINQQIIQQDYVYRGTQAGDVTSSVSIPFDIVHPAVYDFIVPDNAEVEAVYLYAKTNAFLGTTKAAASTILTQNAVVAGGGGGAISNQNSSNIPSNTWTTLTTQAFSIDTLGVWCTLQVSVPGGASSDVWQMRVTDGTNTYSSEQHRFPFPNNGTDATFTVLYPLNANGKTLTIQFFQSNSTTITFNWSSNFNYLQAAPHNHGASGHTHALQFGMFQFSGDNGMYTQPIGVSGTQIGTPMYPTRIQLFVDKLPNDPTAVPYQPWGVQGIHSGQTIVTKLDVTAALRGANGAVLPGPHFFAFAPYGAETGDSGSGIADTNVNNLGMISVNHLIKINTKGQVRTQ